MNIYFNVINTVLANIGFLRDRISIYLDSLMSMLAVSSSGIE